MSEIKVYTPTVIAESPFPTAEAVQAASSGGASSSGGVYTPASTPDQSFPQPKIATELLGTALNTRSKKILAQFEFTQSGALQIGKYENGVSGDLRISPVGIVARNSAGIITFSLDGENGDAYFMGTIQAGTLVGGAVAVGDGSILIDGETKRLVFFDDAGIPIIIIGNA